MLEHQQALFRRGDTALVVLAYDVRRIAARGNARKRHEVLCNMENSDQQSSDAP